MPRSEAALDVIAGQDAEAARIDRQRFVDAELGGEVGDRPRPEHAGVPRAPGVARAQVLLKAAVGVVDAAVQRQLRGPLLELVDRDLLQQGHRIVVERAPEDRIELAEEAGRIRVPAPPQVLRERAQPLMRRGDELPERPRFRDDRRQLRAGHGQQRRMSSAPNARGVDGLDDQHALQQAAVDDRDAEERAVGILAGVLGKILEARMRRRVGDELRPEPFGDEAGQAFRAASGPGRRSRLQADGCGEDQVGAIGLEQVDRADVGAEPALNELNDVDSVSAALPLAETRRPMSSSVQEVADGGSGAAWLTVGVPSLPAGPLRTRRGRLLACGLLFADALRASTAMPRPRPRLRRAALRPPHPPLSKKRASPRPGSSVGAPNHPEHFPACSGRSREISRRPAPPP